MSRPDDLKYTQDHEWIRVLDDTRAELGITDYAVQQLNDIVYVDLPEIDDLTEKKQPFAEVESVKAVADINAPASGEVYEVNEEIGEHLDTLAKDPFRAGWLARIVMSNHPADLEDLLDRAAYDDYVASLDH